MYITQSGIVDTGVSVFKSWQQGQALAEAQKAGAATKPSDFPIPLWVIPTVIVGAVVVFLLVTRNK